MEPIAFQKSVPDELQAKHKKCGGYFPSGTAKSSITTLKNTRRREKKTIESEQLIEERVEETGRFVIV
jgi:hypothetical protein